MKRIQYVEAIPAEGPNGQPILTETRQQVTLGQYDFLRERTTDAPFVEGLKGFEAQEMIYETRRALREQRDEAPKRGYWELEDEPAKRLLKSIDEGNYNQVAFNAIPFMRAVRAMTTPVAPAEEKPATNGAAAQA
jgi:hypothetical protein